MGKKKRSIFKNPKNSAFQIPGSLTYIGKEVEARTEITLTKYNLESVLKESISSEDQLNQLVEEQGYFWLDVDGVHETSVIERLGKKINLHPMLLEDVLNTTQKPKLEFFEDENQLFVVLKMLSFDDENIEIDTEQISLILGKNYVVSFQEKDQTDVFDNIHTRINNPLSRIRKYHTDYLLYALMDLIIDNYYIVLDKVTTKLETLEIAVLEDPEPIHQNQIYLLKKELAFMKRSILPLRDIIGSLLRENSDLVGNQVNVYLRDLQDHVLQNLETIDGYRDTADSIMANYHASLSNKMNSVMKTLTVFTVIFMPLSFIAGLYGMNFTHMPELNNPYAYPVVLVIMFAMAVGLWFYFKWKKFV